jgi:hypothetical protein
MASIGDFRLDDQTWAEISNELAHFGWCERGEEAERGDLEYHLAGWLEHPGRERIAALRRTVELARRMLVAASEANLPVKLEIDGFEIDETVAANWHKVERNILKRPNLAGWLCQWWWDSGRPLQSSFDNNRGHPTGPLIRFLTAVCAAFEIDLKPNSADYQIDKCKEANGGLQQKDWTDNRLNPEQDGLLGMGK